MPFLYLKNDFILNPLSLYLPFIGGTQGIYIIAIIYYYYINLLYLHNLLLLYKYYCVNNSNTFIAVINNLGP